MDADDRAIPEAPTRETGAGHNRVYDGGKLVAEWDDAPAASPFSASDGAPRFCSLCKRTFYCAECDHHCASTGAGTPAYDGYVQVPAKEYDELGTYWLPAVTWEAIQRLRARLSESDAKLRAMWEEREGWKRTASERGFEVLALRKQLAQSAAAREETHQMLVETTHELTTEQVKVRDLSAAREGAEQMLTKIVEAFDAPAPTQGAWYGRLRDAIDASRESRAGSEGRDGSGGTLAGGRDGG